MIPELNQRSQDIFRLIVDAYLETGVPVGSRTLSKLLVDGLSPATIRNVMQDLEDMGLLYAPHTSAGRLPTEHGLRLFVDGLMEVANLDAADKQQIEALQRGHSTEQVYADASSMLAGLSSCAGVVLTPTAEKPIKSIQFTLLSPGQALVIVVGADGSLENRLMQVPLDVSTSTLLTASNYLNDRLSGRTLAEAKKQILDDIQNNKSTLDRLTAAVVAQGLASTPDNGGTLVVRGTAQLLNDVKAIEELTRIRKLFEALEKQETILKLLDAAQTANGIRIFIGAENQIFGDAGLSMIVSPYKDSQKRVVGAIGVIGPTRVNYGRIVPIVDYTSQILARLVGS